MEHGAPLRLIQQARDASLMQEPALPKEDVLYDKGRADAQLRDKRALERLSNQTRVISERLKKTEKDGATLQRLDVLVQQVVDSQKADRQTVCSLRSELHAVKAQLSAPRTCSSSSAGGGGGGEGRGREVASVATGIINARLAEEIPRLKQDVERVQTKMLREWAQTMTQALHQRNGDLEQARGLGDEVAKLSSRVVATVADAVKRDKRLLETCSKEVSTAIAALVEKINASTAVSQREHLDRLASLENRLTQVHADNYALQQQLVNVLSQMDYKDHIIEALGHRVEVLEASIPPAAVDTNPFNQFIRHLYLPEEEEEEEDSRGGAVDAFPAYESKLHESIQYKKRLTRQNLV